ncbi:hypothetical protein D3C81_1545280 [compost metagenome]
MKWKDMLENWGLTSIKLNYKFAEMEFTPNPEDEIAAWEMYVELIRRVSTQELPDEYGHEETALSRACTQTYLSHNRMASNIKKAMNMWAVFS